MLEKMVIVVFNRRNNFLIQYGVIKLTNVRAFYVYIQDKNTDVWIYDIY